MTGRPERDLAGAHVAVLGATGALGSRVVRELSGAGALVTVVGRDRDRLTALGAGGTVLTGDVSDARLGDELVAVVDRDHDGRLDGLINAAGVVAFGTLVDTDDTVLEQLFLTNVVGPLFLLRRVIPALGRSHGFIAQISGLVAERPTAGMAAYSASKAALAALDTALAVELRRSGVDVIDVRPPHTETGLASRPLSGTAPRLPQGLDPDEVARRVVAAVRARERVVPAEAFAQR
ncbi:SDR family NAD(P)-dependent oxidoreductase [Ornithinimicrobium cerasi]|uniref:Short-chain dehydrogenase n=1 Tax=Ornithinimicrobium cerasi TaxID=2248773 RepID=A0A285VCY8_9MICO|nr:SDR family oxidoreductase [Ornithinimicrobium cerasi]SOC51438.1 Short-chain dehydrogenase [Ornithinimicrobium cerasi]